jgi:hypothetical protein
VTTQAAATQQEKRFQSRGHGCARGHAQDGAVLLKGLLHKVPPAVLQTLTSAMLRVKSGRVRKPVSGSPAWALRAPPLT